MWTALLAFAGGVFAVGLKGYADYLLQRRRERRALQYAASLVYEELWVASFPIDEVDPDDFASSAWDEHKAVFGHGAIDFENWRHRVFGYRSAAWRAVHRVNTPALELGGRLRRLTDVDKR